jgi:acetylornithine/N-succinyldiaminopimelate aminotransferase
VLDTVAQPAFLAAVNARAAQMQRVLDRHAGRCGGTVRAAGLLQALVLPVPEAARVVQAARERGTDAGEPGLLLNAARPDVLRLMPALNVSAEEIDRMDSLLGAALDEVLT